MNGGLGAPEPIRAETGREYGELPAAVREGCRFAGWYPAEGGSLPVTADTIVTAETDHTLRAAWEAAEISVSFDANGGKKITAAKAAAKKTVILPGRLRQLAVDSSVRHEDAAVRRPFHTAAQCHRIFVYGPMRTQYMIIRLLRQNLRHDAETGPGRVCV